MYSIDASLHLYISGRPARLAPCSCPHLFGVETLTDMFDDSLARPAIS